MHSQFLLILQGVWDSTVQDVGVVYGVVMLKTSGLCDFAVSMAAVPSCAAGNQAGRTKLQCDGRRGAK